jgi:cobalt-zinc-cadmium efflux system protein
VEDFRRQALSQDHRHHHGADSGSPRRLAAVLGISAGILVVEVIGAVVSGSLALLADAGHLLTDVFGLTLALAAAVLSRRPATPSRTWGFLRAEVLAAAGQAAVLLAVGCFVIVEAVRRLVDPPEVASTAMIVFGLVGLAGNSASIALLVRTRTHDMNMRAAFLEVVNDAFGSLAVLLAAATIAISGWQRADPVASMVIGFLILPRTWRLLRETVDVLLEATPRDLDLTEVREHIRAVRHVHDVHDLHASRVSSRLPVLTAHVVVDESCFSDGQLPRLLDELQNCLAGHFDVEHSTFQFEALGHVEHERSTHH